MGLVLSTLLYLRGQELCHAFDHSAKHLTQSQQTFLLDIVRRNKDTEYGKKYRFGSISTVRDFKRLVPLIEFRDIEASIEKLKNGQKNILTEEPPFMFSLTSGTSAAPKYIPLTQRGQQRTELLMQQWLFRAISDHPSFLNHKFLGITGAATEGRLPCGIPYGSASGMIYTTLPGIVKKTYAMPMDVSSIPDYDFRYYLTARFAFEQSISFIATPNPRTLSRLSEVFQERAEEIIRAIHNGWLSDTLRSVDDFSNARISGQIQSWVKPNKARASALEKVLCRKDPPAFSDYWPDLALIGCWLGGSIGFHLRELKQRIGDIPVRDIGYMASEGCMSLPIKDSTPAGILAIGNHFYEFIPESDMDAESPETLDATELKQGCKYKIVITNYNGLYRYDINDIITVEGHYHQVPIISFMQKFGNMVNIAGEKLHLNHVLYALQKIQSLLKIAVLQFRVAPDITSARYEFFFEICPGSSEEYIRTKLVPALDEYLCETNIEYANKRKSRRLNMPLIHIMDQSWVDETIRIERHKGIRDVQHKWVQLSTSRIENDYRYIRYSLQPSGAQNV
jgi:hypothetical protein